MSDSNATSSGGNGKEKEVPPQGHSSAFENRPNTGVSASLSGSTDPFSTPMSSRAPSIRQQPPSPDSLKTSFPEQREGGGYSTARSDGFSTPNGGGFQTQSPNGSQTTFSPVAVTAARRPILSQSGFGASSFPSARSSVARLSSPVLFHGGANEKSSTPKPKMPRMKSHMLPLSPDGVTPQRVPKPWREAKNPRAIFSYWIVYAIIFCGIAGGAIQCYFTWIRVALDEQPLCMVLEENFDGTEESVFGEGGTFMREVNMDGNGNGEFEMTTSSRNNSFISNGLLYIVPTLTSDNIGLSSVLDGTVYNITDCTFNLTRPNGGFIPNPQNPSGPNIFDVNGYLKSCSAVSNATSGSVINPVQSARITTQKSASIRYGRVEIRAKMPNGDWLWPAMWMLPKDSVYGAWPRSGEIDIVESRGNGLRYTAHGSNYVQGALNWGPSPQLNGVSKSYSWWTDKRKSFASEFHTYALEWTPEFLRIYVDTRLHTLLDMRFSQPFFQRGDFPDVVFNGSSLVALENPWINGTNATPFDQDFYLILNVAVGGTGGWFPEGQGDKPWLDRAQNPPRDFIGSLAQWYPTWPSSVEDRAMIIDYVKLWKHC